MTIPLPSSVRTTAPPSPLHLLAYCAMRLRLDASDADVRRAMLRALEAEQLPLEAE